MARFKKIVPYTSVVLAIIIGAIFIYAGVIKALDPAAFASDIANFRILPWTACSLVALYLPWLEIFCGAALVFRKFHTGAMYILTALTLAFLAALISAKIRGLDISCGCFGHADSHSIVASILLDTGILTALMFMLTVELKKK